MACAQGAGSSWVDAGWPVWVGLRNRQTDGCGVGWWGALQGVWALVPIVTAALQASLPSFPGEKLRLLSVFPSTKEGWRSWRQPSDTRPI